MALVGLGNPGARYARTRHNLGFRVVDRLLGLVRAGRAGGAPDYELWRGGPGGRLLIARPTTFMNASGRAVVALAAREGVALDAFLVICDDVNLPLGRLRIRPGGSDGGHNGLLSVIEETGTTAVPRLRLGVGPRPPGESLTDFVLAAFAEEEETAVEALVARGAEAALAFAERGIDAAMREFNKTEAGEPGE